MKIELTLWYLFIHRLYSLDNANTLLCVGMCRQSAFLLSVRFIREYENEILAHKHRRVKTPPCSLSENN